MKKLLLLIILPIALIYLFLQINEKKEVSDHLTVKQEKEPIKKTSEPMPKRNIQTEKRGNERKKIHTPENAVRKIFKPDEFSARRDDEGNVYPESVGISETDDYVYYENDIIIGDKSILEGEVKIQSPKKWPSNTIRYKIDLELPVEQREKIHELLRRLSEETNLTFATKENHEDYISFQVGKEHCYSFLGYQKGSQPINLSKSCGISEIAHEVLHALGFPHEQSRPDRDDSVIIVWENIPKKYQPQFYKLPENFYLYSLEEFPFDFSSPMLYDSYSFSLSPGIDATMIDLNSNTFTRSQEYLSRATIERINSIYKN